MKKNEEKIYTRKGFILAVILGFILMYTYVWGQYIVTIIFEVLKLILPISFYSRIEFIVGQHGFQDTVLCVALIIVYSIYVLIRNKRLRTNNEPQLIYNRLPNKKDIILGTIIVFACGAISYLWLTLAEYLQNYIPFIKESLEVFSESGEMLVDNDWYIFTFLSVAFVGPIVEELLMRGIIFGEMNRKMPVVWTILFNGLIFGVFHGNFVQGVYTATIGMVFAFVYYYTESFILLCYMHVLNNFKETLPPMPTALEDGFYYGFLILGFICIIPALFAMKYLYQKSKERGIEDGIYGN